MSGQDVRNAREAAIWCAAFGAAWISDVRAHQRGATGGRALVEVLDEDHAEIAATMANAAVRQFREWEKSNV